MAHPSVGYLETFTWNLLQRNSLFGIVCGFVYTNFLFLEALDTKMRKL